MSHPDDSTLERFAMGALEDDSAFVAHVASCDECSRKLQSEAVVELAMFDVRAEATPVAEAQVQGALPVRSVLARRAIGPALAFVAAAAVLVWFGSRRFLHPVVAASAARVVSCPDGDDQLRCIAEANRSGAFLEFPKDTPLAALGREPGFSVVVEPRLSDGTPAELEEYLATAKRILQACAETTGAMQGNSFHVGEVGLTLVIGSDGEVQQTQSLVSYLQPPGEDAAIYTYSESATDEVGWKLARCLKKGSSRFPFKGTGQDLRVGVLAKYVWRE